MLDLLTRLQATQHSRLMELNEQFRAVDGLASMELIADRSFVVLERFAKYEVFKSYVASIKKQLAAGKTESEVYDFIRSYATREMTSRLAGNVSQSTAVQANYHQAATVSANAEVVQAIMGFDA